MATETDWKHPGRLGAVIYALVAVVVSGLVAVFTRVRLAKRQGRRQAVAQLPDGPVIIISNHASYVDGLLLALVCRRMGRSVRLLATAGVFAVPVLRGLVSRLGYIPVQRGTVRAADALGPALSALSAGEAVGIFPEGRTTRDPQHWPERAKTGAVRLALLSGAPIVPVAMVGTHRVLDRDHPVRSVLFNIVLRPRVLVDVGQPIRLVVPSDGSEPSSAVLRSLADDVMATLIAGVAELRREAAPHPTGVDQSGSRLVEGR